MVTITPEQAKNAIQKHAARAQQRARTFTATASAPVTRTPRPARNAAVTRPRSGVCQQIWEVLDAERAANQGDAPSRTRVKELAAQHGWNQNTASVQSSAWRKQNNFP